MLLFERKQFGAGSMLVWDKVPAMKPKMRSKKDEKGKVIKGEFEPTGEMEVVKGKFVDKKCVLTPLHRGKKLKFTDEDYVQKQFPQFLKKVK